MNQAGDEIDLSWRINCSLMITHWWMHLDNPAEKFREWLDEAGEGDEPYMRYAIRAFEYTSHLNYVELEERQETLVRWKEKELRQGSA